MAQSDRLARDPRADMTELSADWLAPAINPTLTRLQDRLPDDGVDMRPHPSRRFRRPSKTPPLNGSSYKKGVA